jgi:hypothetical protein
MDEGWGGGGGWEGRRGEGLRWKGEIVLKCGSAVAVKNSVIVDKVNGIAVPAMQGSVP